MNGHGEFKLVTGTDGTVYYCNRCGKRFWKAFLEGAEGSKSDYEPCLPENREAWEKRKNETKQYSVTVAPPCENEAWICERFRQSFYKPKEEQTFSYQGRRFCVVAVSNKENEIYAREI